MTEKQWITTHGTIHYWVGTCAAQNGSALVFLPGLTADHRLFEKQIAYFAAQHPVLVWDAPAHGRSRPFDLEFTLMDKAKWLNEILHTEGIDRPVLIGQSMGGYVAQAYAEQFPDKLRGFIAIDSAPLQRQYVTGMELWMLKRMEPIYRYYPWSMLMKNGANGVAETAYGRALMREMMQTYAGRQAEYARLSGHGFRMLAEAMEAGCAYRIPCSALLLCGTKDRAGSCIRYNKAWHRNTGIPLVWIKEAGHNANTDQPMVVNRLIEDFWEQIAP